jgi:pimeloyl-ACP methyl ester carboxylesterase
METRTTIDLRSSMVPERFTTGFAQSRDGTRIGFRQIGRGPAIVILHGSMSTGYNHVQPAALLSDAFTVYIPDRRGFGLSGAPGIDYGVQEDVEDLQGILEKTGAGHVFGVSVGGVIALKAALTLPSIRKLALYEPPLFTNRAAPAAVMARFDQELAQGRIAAALTTAMKGVPLASDVFSAMPRWLVEFMTGRMMAFEDKQGPGSYASFRQLAPSLHHDGHVISEMSGRQAELRAIQAAVLLLGGSATTTFLKGSLRSLRTALPQARYVELPGLNHSSAWNSDRGGKPALIAQELRRFFA